MTLFTSIRSKLIAAVLLLICCLGIALLLVGKRLYTNYRNLRVEQCAAQAHEETDALAETIRSLEGNARELAIMGELLLPRPREELDALATRALKENFRINTEALGGGLWYEPRLFGGKLTCFYAMRKGNSLVMDSSFATAAYNYPIQSWYLNAMRHFSGDIVVWSPAYVDEAGAHALMTTISAPIANMEGQIVGMATIDWELADMAARVAAIRPTPHSMAILADIPHNAILGSSRQNAAGALTPLSSLPWFAPNPAPERLITIDGEEYLSFSRAFDNGMMVVVNVPTGELFHSLHRRLLLALLFLLATILLAAAITWTLLNRFINRPVASLCRAAAAVGAGALDTPFNPSSRDEIGSLATSFAAMTASLKDYMARIETITAEKSRMAAELTIARDIQAAMLPVRFPPREDCALATIMRPAREVGGDFYDFFFITPDRLGVIIADVSDKGIPAALFMAIAKVLIRNCCQTASDPGAALTAANAQLNENNDACMFVTAFAAVLDLGDGTFSYANAGHNPFYLCQRSHFCAAVPLVPAPPLAALPHTPYAAHTLKLEPGSIIFLYTDGVTEASNGQGQFFGADRLQKALNECFQHRDLSLTIGAIMARLGEFTQGAAQSDDITMLALEYKGRVASADLVDSRSFAASLASLDDFMGMIEAALDKGDFSPRQRMRFCVAAEEVFVNIVNYAYNGEKEAAKREISTSLAASPSLLRLALTDSGAPFNPLERKLPDMGAAAEEREPGGLGIYLAIQGTDSIQYRRERHKNILTLTLRAGASEEPA